MGSERYFEAQGTHRVCPRETRWGLSVNTTELANGSDERLAEIRTYLSFLDAVQAEAQNGARASEQQAPRSQRLNNASYRSFFHGSAGKSLSGSAAGRGARACDALFVPSPGAVPDHQHRHDRDLSGHRWTVDTAEDLELVRRIFESLYPSDPCFLMEDV